MMNQNQKRWLYLYSTPNIVGSALGILGLLLFFTGVIGQFWWLIVPSFYAIGVVVTPGNQQIDLVLRHQLSIEELQVELEELVRKIRHQVPAEILSKVEHIKGSIVSILPYIVDVNSADHSVHVIRQTVLDYLPATLQNYTNLPPAFANLHPVRNGKTARQLLSEQLDLLDKQMAEVAVDLAKNDTQKLLAHGRFLEAKFSKSDLLTAN